MMLRPDHKPLLPELVEGITVRHHTLPLRQAQGITFRNESKRGFTLVELVVVISLFTVIGGLAIGFFISTITGRAKAQARIETQEHARFAMHRMAYEIRRAQGIELTSDFGVNLATTSGATLDLDMADAARDPTTFDVAGSAVELTSDDVSVTSLTFDDRSSPNGRSTNIKMTLTVEHAATAPTDLPFSFTLHTTVELRDKP